MISLFPSMGGVPLCPLTSNRYLKNYEFQQRGCTRRTKFAVPHMRRGLPSNGGILEDAQSGRVLSSLLISAQYQNVK